MELEDIGKFISPQIKQKIEYEGMNLNMLPKEIPRRFWSEGKKNILVIRRRAIRVVGS